MFATRPGAPEDSSAVGRVHVRAWQAAYRGLMPEEYLDGLSADQRGDMWRQAIGRPRGRPSVLIAERDGQVLGFAAVGAARSGEQGEIYALNVDPDVWGQGAGRALLAAAYDELRALGYDSAILWVHPDNRRARRFYEAAGWRGEPVERMEDVLGVVVPEVRYRRSLEHAPAIA